MDVLSSILKVTRLEAIVCSTSMLKGPWGLDVAQTGEARFYRLIKGSCIVSLYNDQPVTMGEGDMVYIPHGDSHWIADSAASRRVTINEYVRSQTAGTPFFSGPEPETILAAGHFSYNEDETHPFLKDLPPIIHIRGYGTLHHQFLRHTGYVIHTESAHEKPGSQMMLKSLAEMLFVSVIRTYIEQSVPETGFLAALNDSQISKALSIMHNDPAQDWTLQSLAKSVAMSRSVFAGRFKSLVGETPLSYLTNWRINRAKELLIAEKINVSDVAFKVGYQSEAAFNRVFKARTGKTPAMYRRIGLEGTA